MFKEYFGHDYNARHDFKIMSLRAKMGFEGYGLFWMLVEELYCNGNSLPLDGIEVLAHCNKVGAAKLRRVVMEFGLFEVDEAAGTFSSRRIGEALNSRNGKAEERKASAATAAAARWGAKKPNAGAAQREEDAGRMDDAAQSGCETDAERITDAMRNGCGTDASRIADTMRGGCEADAGRIADTMRNDANKRKEEKRKEKKKITTTSSSAVAQTPGSETPTSGNVASPPPQGATEEDIGAEIRELLGNESVQYQIAQKSGFRDVSAVEGYIAEFAGQLALEGKGDEHGMRLALHFAYWLAKKRERQLKTNGQAGNHGNQDIGGNNGDGAVADPAALLGWQYPAAAYGVKPTDAEIREELRHRKVLQGAYALIAGSSRDD